MTSTMKAEMQCGEKLQIKTCVEQTSRLQISAFLLGLVGWILCITSTANREWRVWHFENITNSSLSIMWIGIWAVCFNNVPKGENVDITQCEDFSDTHIFLPREIFVAQDLMSLAIIVEAAALSVILFAFWLRIYKSDQNHKLMRQLFCIGGIINLISGMVVFIPVSWNMVSVWMKQKIVFPESFELPSSPHYQNAGIGLKLGFASASLQIASGGLMLFDLCFWAVSKVRPSDIETIDSCERRTDITYNSSMFELVKEIHESVSDVDNIEAPPKDGMEQCRTPTDSFPGGRTVTPRLIIVTPFVK